jgi:peptidyl-prolyl cis-trans isomerase C
MIRANHQGVFMPFCFGPAARLSVAACVAAALASGFAWAQSAPPTASAAAPATAAADPVVAKVNGKPILLSDIKDAIQSLPQNAQSLPPQTLYPMLLDQMIDGRALVAEAQRTGLDKDPAVQRQVAAAEEQALETALLHKDIAPLVTEAAVRARYDAEIAGKPGVDEVHARHILVPDEATAKQVIAELNKGGDFAALSKQYSKDPGAAQQGGDLGWFKKDEMVPEFADAAFALKPGQVDPTPVHTQFGWHVIQVLERRTDPPPSYEQASQELRQKMIQEAVQQAVAHARAQVTVEKFNLDGSAVRATDNAEPPPAK